MNGTLERRAEIPAGVSAPTSSLRVRNEHAEIGNRHAIDSVALDNGSEQRSLLSNTRNNRSNEGGNKQTVVAHPNITEEMEESHTQPDNNSNERQFEQIIPTLPQVDQRSDPAGNRAGHIENQVQQPPPNRPQAATRPPDPYEEEYREFMDTIASEYSPNEITHGNIINPVLAMAIGAKIAQIAATPLHALALMGIPPIVSAGVNLTSQRILGSFRESAGRFLVKMNSFSNRGFFLFRAIDKIVNPLSRKLTNTLILNDGGINQIMKYTRDQNALNQMTALHNNRLEHLLDIATHAHVLVKTVENSAPAEGVNFGQYQGQFERYRQAAEMAPSLYSRLVRRRQRDRDWYRAGIRRDMPNRVNKIDQGLWRKGALIGEPIGNLWPAALGFAAYELISGNALTAAKGVVKDIGSGLDWVVAQVNNWWSQQAIPWIKSIL